MLFLSSPCQPVLAVKPCLPYPLNVRIRSWPSVTSPQYIRVTRIVTWPLSPCTDAHLYGLVRPLRPYHPYQPIPPLNSLLSLCSQLLCVFTSYLICLNSSQQLLRRSNQTRMNHFVKNMIWIHKVVENHQEVE